VGAAALVRANSSILHMSEANEAHVQRFEKTRSTDSKPLRGILSKATKYPQWVLNM